MLDFDPAARKRCIDALRWAMAREADYPPRPEIRKKLDALERSARAILDALEDVRMSELVWGANDWLDAVGMAEPLRELIRRVEEIKRKNPPRQGRGRLYPYSATGPSANELCALIAAMMWKQIKGRWPGQRGAAANELCEQLWTAAGGTAHGPVLVEPFWRDYLKSAERFAPPHAAGQHVAALLSPPS